MSTTYSTYLLIGVRFSDVFKVTHAEQEVVRYNEESGKAYLKKVTQLKFTLFSKPIPEPKGCWPAHWPELNGLDVVDVSNASSRGWDTDYSAVFVGRIIAQGSPDRKERAEELPTAVPADEVEGRFQELGYTGPLSMWLLSYAG